MVDKKIHNVTHTHKKIAVEAIIVNEDNIDYLAGRLIKLLTKGQIFTDIEIKVKKHLNEDRFSLKVWCGTDNERNFNLCHGFVVVFGSRGVGTFDILTEDHFNELYTPYNGPVIGVE